MNLGHYQLAALAARVGTPFYLYDGDLIEQRFETLAALTAGPHLQARYAIKANPARQILEIAGRAGLWIDAVSGNEVLLALRAGFPAGSAPPAVMLTCDVFRDQALQIAVERGIQTNVGSPGMVRDLIEAGYRGPIAVRVNPGFGHGHVQACDTGGPSSKHGIWPDDLGAVRDLAASGRLPITALHAHVGTGPQIREFDENMRRVAQVFAQLLPDFPDLEAVNLGGGIPHPYRPGAQEYDLTWYRPVLTEASAHLAEIARRPIRVEIEPGRYPVAGAGLLVTRVTDVKRTRANAKGEGHTFIMVDAGFNDLARPAMYGSYHHISILGAGADRDPEPFVVAGPLCESGDVFTRDDQELLVPRQLGRPDPGDLLVLHDAGAYGAAMSSNYVSIGRSPQVLWRDGTATLISRRETLEDLVARESDEPLPILG